MSDKEGALAGWLQRRFADPLAALDLEHDGMVLGRAPEDADDEDEGALDAL